MNDQTLLRGLLELDEEIERIEAAIASCESGMVPSAALGVSQRQRLIALTHLRRLVCARLHRIQNRLFGHVRRRRIFR